MTAMTAAEPKLERDVRPHRALAKGAVVSREDLPRTWEEYEAYRGELRLEWVQGEAVEKPGMSLISNYIATNLSGELRAFVKPRKLGVVLTSEAQYRCFPDDSTRVRKPDVTFIRRERLTSAMFTGFIPIAPDLAAEVVSPNDEATNLDERVADLLRAGVELVWVLYPATRTVLVYRGEGSVSRVTVEGELSGEEVLPGFACGLEELFASPPVAMAAEAG